jgi:osmotically-inducible protein OsmY
MKKLILCLLMALSMTGCSPIGVGTAELTGISLFHDRRNVKPLLIDEKIESQAAIALNLDPEIRKYVHFNVTSYNGILLLTGEAPAQNLVQRMTEISQSITDVKLVQNQVVISDPTSFARRANDSVITSKVKFAISSDPDMPGFDAIRIKVVTENSRVFLMGLVYEREGNIATEAARLQPGVSEVIKVFEYL